MIKINLVQGSPEWLEFRKSHIGASHAPSIMGVGFKTPYQLWEELALGKQTFVTDAMRAGINLEPQIRSRVEDKLGRAFPSAVIKSDEISWISASLDGINEDREEILEIKLANKKDHELASRGIIPEKYWPQVQHQLVATKYKEGYYASFHQGDLAIVEFEKNEDYCKKLLKKEEEFLQCLLDFIPPPLCDMDYVQQTSQEWLELAKKYALVSEQLKGLELEESALKRRLIELSSGKNSIGSGIKLQKIVRKGNVDYSLIPELKSVNLESYRKKSIDTWRVQCQ